MTELERFLTHARPDCPRCGGTGLVEEGKGSWVRGTDHVCICVPIMIIRTVDE